MTEDLTVRKLPHAAEYRCPTCKTEPPDNDRGYRANKKLYPKYFNERKGGNAAGDYWDWDEVHYCKKCKAEYYYTNGAY